MHHLRAGELLSLHNYQDLLFISGTHDLLDLSCWHLWHARGTDDIGVCLRLLHSLRELRSGLVQQCERVYSLHGLSIGNLHEQHRLVVFNVLFVMSAGIVHKLRVQRRQGRVFGRFLGRDSVHIV